MATTMAGLATAQSDMLISLAEEVDRQTAEVHRRDVTIAGLTAERDYWRTAAENAQASVQAGWGRAHALTAELRARDQALAEATAEIERLRAGGDTAALDRLMTMGWRA